MNSNDILFAGKNGFYWWFGIVESNGDPLCLGRCRVRIHGWHNENDVELPTDSLPWAYPTMPLTNACIAGIGEAPVGPQPGSKVWGFFIDGQTGQQPVMIGAIPGESVYEYRGNLEYGSTPWQPSFENDFNPQFSREGDCPDGYDEDTTRSNTKIPDQRNININPSEWSLPFTGFVSSAYNESRGSSSHHGVDICPAGFYSQSSAGSSHLNGRLRGPTGLPVYAAAGGEVVYIWKANKGQRGVQTQYDKTGRGSRSYGNAIAIRHKLSTGTYTTIYAHLGVSQDAGLDVAGAGIEVMIGDTITKGQRIGTCGRSHVYNSLTHLHFEIRIGTELPAANNHINPGRVFPQLFGRHWAYLSWVNSQTKYNIENLPFSVADAPVIAKQNPIV